MFVASFQDGIDSSEAYGSGCEYAVFSVDFSIRPLQESDLKDVRTLLTQFSSFFPSLQEMQDAFATFSGCDSYACVACKEGDGEISGVGFVYFLQKIRGGVAGQIEDIAVKKEIHGCGVGSLIIGHLIEKCLEKGCYCASLCCKEENVVFYSKQGFEKFEVAMREKFL